MELGTVKQERKGMIKRWGNVDLGLEKVGKDGRKEGKRNFGVFKVIYGGGYWGTIGKY